MDLQFRLKKINFFHRDIVIICQNENGPCPLIGIANNLLLKGIIDISTDRSYVSLDEVNQYVADALIEENAKRVASANEVRRDCLLGEQHQSASGMIGGSDGHNTSHISQIVSNHEEINHHIEDVLAILPKLAKGLDLNVHFNAVNKYEFTQEITIFDALNIPLVHGWLYDESQDPELIEVIGNKSYNLLLNDLVEYHSLQEMVNRHANRYVESLVSHQRTDFQSNISSIHQSQQQSQQSHSMVAENIQADDSQAQQAATLSLSPILTTDRTEGMELHTPGTAISMGDGTQSTSGCSDQTQETAMESPYLPHQRVTSSPAIAEAAESESFLLVSHEDHINSMENSQPTDMVSAVNSAVALNVPTPSSASIIPTRTEPLTDTLTLTDAQMHLLKIGPRIDRFLHETASQLTEKGIFRLYDFMNDRQTAVFFRNNHFSTLFAYNGQLFLLLTDLGFVDQPAVWELLVNVDGETEFFNDQFIPLSELPPEHRIQTNEAMAGVGIMDGYDYSSSSYAINPSYNATVGQGTVCSPPSAIPSTSRPSPSRPTIVMPSALDLVGNVGNSSSAVAAQLLSPVLPVPLPLAPATESISSPLHHNGNVSGSDNQQTDSSIHSFYSCDGYEVVGEAKVISAAGSNRSAAIVAAPSTVVSSIPTTKPYVDEDADLQFALQLQQQLDREAELAATHQQHLQSTGGNRVASSLPHQYHETELLNQYQHTEQVDRDQQLALELFYQEMNAAGNNQQGRPATSNRGRANPSPARRSNNDASGGKGCIIN